jgi:hypothetical protein
MRSPRAKSWLIAGGVLAAALPALAAASAVSVLPPGFGDPVPPPPPPPTQPEPTPDPGVTDPAEPPPGFGEPDQPSPRRPAERIRPVEAQETVDSAVEDLEALPPPQPARFYDLPEGALRPVDVVGVIGADNRGLPIDAFGDATGPWLRTLMQRLDAPIPSRWTSILLRRALMSRVTAPRATHPVDWVAERTRLLLRMGEADAARMLAQSVDIDNYTPAMVGAAYEAALASSDPAGLCPLVEKGRELSQDTAWPMAGAMCAAMEGEQERAGTLLDEARRRGARGVDLLLAEKVIGASANTRRSVSIQWDPVNELNLWRFGLASATGSAVPERLTNIAGPRMQAWLARAPMVPVGQRLAAAEVAAALGVFSAHSLVDTYALAADLHQEDQPEPTTALLQRAYSGGDQGARLAALRELWEEGDEGLRRHGRLLLTSGPAALIDPSEESAGEADRIVAALLAAGMDQQAARWADLAEAGGRAWALLAVGSPRPVDNGAIDQFGNADTSQGRQRTLLLAAALAGLGRIEPEQARNLGVDVGRSNDWTQALDRAASGGQGGTVALLAAIGMQAPDWNGVPPDHLFHIVRALRQAGMDYEARMIAAEALIRT